ncbi:MAG: hypothetical protein IPH71_14025 [Proteobacteria bacterium]|jgi:hypothetical protein|nr:hypothetical protein [Pseudomonadota bacterium]
MKYGVWLVRLIFASWMIPAGVNHFVRLFPQPMGNQPLSQELITALIDSNIFDLVKTVELVAGVMVLSSSWTPLGLLICLPVSFCVFWWDAPLEGFGSRAALFGYSVLACNLLLCLAYIRSYRSMFALRSLPEGRRRQLVLAGRVVFGLWMLANGLNHFVYPMWDIPAGHGSLATQLMAAFSHSGLFSVAMLIQMVGGALILVGVFVPAALCVVMPVSTCALYWSVVLDHDPQLAVLAVVAFALNGLLMLAHLPFYRGALEKHALSLGESRERPTFASVYALVGARTARGAYIAALITLLVAVWFYAHLVTGRTALYCMLVLLIPGIILLNGRLRDMGQGASLLILPASLLLTAFGIWLKLVEPVGWLGNAVPGTALVVAATIAAWGCIAPSRAARY